MPCLPSSVLWLEVWIERILSKATAAALASATRDQTIAAVDIAIGAPAVKADEHDDVGMGRKEFEVRARSIGIEGRRSGVLLGLDEMARLIVLGWST